MKASAIHQEQLEKMKARPGFSVALDQSGGSTPGVLNAWSNEKEVLALVHQMRTRIITSPSFNGERILLSKGFRRSNRMLSSTPSSTTPFKVFMKRPTPERNQRGLWPMMPNLDFAFSALCHSRSGILPNDSQ